MELTESECAFLRVCKGIVDQKKVIYAPYSLICEGAESCLEHRQERREEISVGHVSLVLESVKVFSHARVCRVVVHVTHADYLYARIFLLHLHRMIIHYLASSVAKLVAPLLAAGARRKMGHIYRKMLTVNGSVNHEDITCPEIVPFLLRLDPVDRAALECERNRFAVEEGEYLRIIEESHIHASSVRTVIMDNLIIRFRYLRLHDEILEHKPVLYFRNAEKGMPCSVLLLHGLYDLGHVLKLLLIFRLSPFVFSFREEFLVVLRRIVVCVKEILQIVESYDMVLFTILLSRCTCAE